MVIKRIAPVSAAKVAGTIYALVSMPVALLLWIVSLVGLNDAGLTHSPFLPFAPGYVMAGGAVAVVLIPLLYGSFCFVTALVGAALYNLVAGFVGGVHVDIQVEPAPGAGV